MTKHDLTSEQMKKFMEAVGIVFTRPFPSGELTTKQLREFAESAGGIHDFPKMTDDPAVNYAVDCVTGDEGDELGFDERLYHDEVEAYKSEGLLVCKT